MPQYSRDRHRGYERERGRGREDRGIDRRRRRHDNSDGGVYEEVDIGDEEEEITDRERPRRHHRHQPLPTTPPRTRPRRYDPDDDEEDDDDEDDNGDGDVIFVDSRPSFARPPAARPSPLRESPRGGVARDRSRYQQQKAKESPATSPVKKRDRERDREGRRRRDSTTADEGSPTKAGKLRERRGKDKVGYREREREKEETRAAARSGGEEREREPERRRARRREKERKHASADSANSATQLLSADALARLNARNNKSVSAERMRAEREEKARVEKERKRKRKDGIFGGKIRGSNSSAERNKKAGKKRLVSGAILEEGRSPELRVRGGHGKNEKWGRGGGGGDDDDGDSGGSSNRWSRKKKIWIAVGVFVLLLVIVIPVAVVVSGKGDDEAGPNDSNSPPENEELRGINPDSIPSKAKGTYFDPFSWYDTADFNVTYTEETVGGLPIMGLNSTWDDTARPNEHVPPLDKKFPYGKQPIRGVNLGGWLVLEPFITPSFFEQYDSKEVTDEYTLSQAMGAGAKDQLEKHYATFINEQTFREIRDAGLDHVRIPYGYWMVTTYEGDPYVKRVAWRYILRAIEYCRKYGLRVDLDMHGAPGGQSVFNHNGRGGHFNWLRGPDGELNGQRTLDIHDQLSQFFAQPRYKNVIAMYGLVNEPQMMDLEIETVIKWILKAADIIEGNGMQQHIVFADGFLKLSKWKTMLQDTGHNLVLDTHQYTIFDTGLLKLDHTEKLKWVCDDLTELITDSNSDATGFGPTISGEWSQADTDCAKFLNDVGVGTRWEGTMDNPNSRMGLVLTASCPTEAGDSESSHSCSCEQANADPSQYSESYKAYLLTYAEAQMSVFEKAWGWFYWTWKTESAAQWSWKTGMEIGTLPAKAYEPSFKCGDDYPDLDSLPDYY